MGKPVAMVHGMGFATNSTIFPALIACLWRCQTSVSLLKYFQFLKNCTSPSNLQGGLIVSDSLNHSSIVSGVRLYPVKFKTEGKLPITIEEFIGYTLLIILKTGECQHVTGWSCKH